LRKHLLTHLMLNYIYRVDGTVEPLLEHSLEAYQAAVGGYIEPYAKGDGKFVYVNEEGLLHGLERNPFLPVVGDFVVVPEEDA